MTRSGPARSRRRRPPPAIEYAASVLPGLEDVSGEEIRTRLDGARVIETRRGWVVFAYEGQPADLLRLRTTEDVFALLFRTSELPSYRKGAIPLLTQMAVSSVYWDQALLSLYQARRRSVKRITFRVIAQMTGEHGFRRQEVRDAVIAGVQTRSPGWKQVAEDAHLEIWVPVVDQWAAIAVRLSTRAMRHRTYKEEHRPAALRPTMAAAMVRLSAPRPGDRVCDPMCGTGTILAERALAGPYQVLLGGDIDPEVVQAAAVNLSQARVALRSPAEVSQAGFPVCILNVWDVRSLPLHPDSVDVVICNLPFGEKVGSHAENPLLYDRFFSHISRALRPGGRMVLLTSEKELMRQSLDRYNQLRKEREVLVGVLGKAARIYVLRKR